MKLKKRIPLLSLLAILITGCAVSMDSDSHKATGYGSITLTEDVRALDLQKIKYAKVSVLGNYGSEVQSVTCDVTDGTNSEPIVINNIPCGINRIVEVEALDSSKKASFNITMRAICDIKEGENTKVTVNWETTPLGNIIYNLRNNKYDLSRITSLDSLNKLIDSAKDPMFLDYEAIANDYDEESLKEVSSYEIEPSSLDVTYSGPCTVQVCDPTSKVATTTDGSVTVTNITPGKWPVYIIVDEDVKVNKTLSFKTGNPTEYVYAPSSGITFHAYGYTHIWLWDKTSQKNYCTSPWPGDPMEDEGDGWYTYHLEQTSCGVIFSKAGSEKTGDLSQTEGEWWYKDGSWSDEDPSDSINPTILSFTSNKTSPVTGEVTLTIEGSDNKSLSYAMIYEGSNLLKKVYFTDVSDKVTYTWDSSVYKNGEYTLKAVVYDGCNNESNEEVLTLTTINANREPVASITGSGVVSLGKTKTYKGTSSYDPNGDIVSYSWKASGATIKGLSSEDSVTVEFPSSPSTCTLSLTVTDNEGATNTTSKTITVKEMKQTDFRDETIYFAMTTRFYDGDISNNVHCWDENATTPANDPAWRGDFKGLIEKLDYIKALGFSSVWITPVVENCSGLDYHGYHAMNFSKVDPRYASDGKTGEDAFQELLDELHSRDMKLVLDVVFQHTGNFGEAYLCPMFEKDYSKNLEDINECLKFSENSLLPANYPTMKPGDQYQTRLALMKNTDGVNHDYRNFYHHFGYGNWDNFSCQFMQIAGDCVDLNTENPAVLEYIVDAYSKYIKMGVDAFRIDTGKHISRLSFNNYLNDAFMARAAEYGNDNFYMFSEICARSTEAVYRNNMPNGSSCFYTWKEEKAYPWSNDPKEFEGVKFFVTNTDEASLLSDTSFFERETEDGETFTPTNYKSVQALGMDTGTPYVSSMPKSNNAFLNGNAYHTPDYSKASGLNVIDFTMHWNFGSASGAYSVRGSDDLYNDATWNVVYVDSHDYGPGTNNRYDGDEEAWAENMDLMWSFRGIPCLYYGSEVRFQAGVPMDKGPDLPLCDSGRAYYGDYIEGNVTASDFGVYKAQAGSKVEETLNMPLCQHLMDLNDIRRAIPALQKGQYSCDNATGNMSFRRRYTSDEVDSFALVTISGDATFSNLPAGEYIDVVTGDRKTVKEGGSITTSGCTGKANMRVYVNTTLDPSITGKLATRSSFLK